MHSQFSMGGLRRIAYLENTSTDVEIQAALNGDYEVVLLEAGTYNIGQNVVIPDGKVLSAILIDTDPATAANVILNIASGFQIQVQRGTLQHVRITVDSASVIDPVTCAGGRVLYTHVTTTAGISARYAFLGYFAELGWCSSLNISGIHINGTLPSNIGKYQNIHNGYFKKGNTSQNTVWSESISYVAFRDIHAEDGAMAFNIGVDRYGIIENLYASGTVGSSGIYLLCGVSTQSVRISGLYSSVTGGSSSILLSGYYHATIEDIYSWSATGIGLSLNCSYSNIRNVNIIGCTGTRGIQIATATNVGTMTDVLVKDYVRAGGYAIYFDNVQNIQLTNVRIVNPTGSTTTYGFYGTNTSNLMIRGMMITGCTGMSFFLSNGHYSNISKLYTYNGGNTTAQIHFNSGDYCTITDVRAIGSAGEGIRSNLTIGLNAADWYTSGCAKFGIHIYTDTDCTFKNLTALNCTQTGICFGTAATSGDKNVRCLLDGIKTSGGTTIGFASYYSEYCTFSNINSYDNTTDGVLETHSLSCKFADVLSVANGQHNISAGSGASYCTWTNVHAQAATNTNFFGFAATADCYYDGGYEQGAGIANDNFPLVNWTTVNVRAI